MNYDRFAFNPLRLASGTNAEVTPPLPLPLPPPRFDPLFRRVKIYL